jgi:hypothetical protein
VSLNDEMARQTNERDAYEYRQHMRTQLACARARAEAWHKVAKQWKAQCGGVARMLKIVTLADERELDCARRRAEAWHQAAKREREIVAAAREFVRLYGDGGVSSESSTAMFWALDRLREVVGGEQ